MSESISMAHDSPEPAKDSKNSKEKTQSSRVVIATALMASLTTIGVSFIGIVPQLRRGDTETIRELRREFNLLRDKTSATDKSGPALENKLTIHGIIKNGTRPLDGVEVYVLPADKGLSMDKTNEEGVFNIPNLVPGTYWIIGRDTNSGNSFRTLVDKKEGDIVMKGPGAKGTYHVR
jgi:hypothetical protein